jgi:hypothetical protein
MTTEPALERAIERLLPPGSEPHVLAVIWATVDFDRVLAGIGLAGEMLPDDPLLGAAVRLVRPPGAEPIALLEPTTEGRIAATLAQSGEGPAGQYFLATGGLAGLVERAAAAGIGIRRAADGPFGPSALVLDRPPAGPHLVLVEGPAGTIDR